MPGIKKIYILFVLLPAMLLGAPVTPINNNFEHIDILQNADIFVDSSAQLNLDDILAPERNRLFTPNTNKEPYFGYQNQSVWIRFSVSNKSDKHKICYIRYPYPIIQKVSVYQFGINNTVDSSFAGYTVPERYQSSSNARPIFKIHLLPSEIKTVYLRFDNGKTEFPMPLEFMSDISLINSNEYLHLLYGIMYGLIIFIVLLNFFLFINLRKKIYTFFIFYVLAVGFYFTIRDGFAFKYFWNFTAWVSNQAIFLGAELPIVFLLLFTRHALKTGYYMPRIDRLLQYLLYLNILLIAVAPFLAAPPYILCNATILLCMAPVTYASIKALKLNSLSLPKYFFIAIVFLDCGIALLLLKNFGIISFWTGELSFRFGFLLQLIGLTFGLTAMFKNILKQINSQAILNLKKLNSLKDQINIDLELKVEERTHELNQKNNELTNAMRELGAERDIYQVQRDMIKKQTDETTDSIRYAERLQKNLSKNSNYLLSELNGFFIVDRPKAIVSGDFYWVQKINNTLLIAVADCTGHGVPGAFMSVLGITYLNDIIKYDHTCDPAEILFELRKKVIKSLSNPENEANSAKDGMDIALVSINLDNLEMKYAGAYNPLYIVRKTELLTFSGDKMPISIHERQNLPFTTHKFTLQEEDNLYLFSDGYVDQFGWRTGKKFKNKQFKQLLLELNDVPIEAQKAVLEKTLNSWIGDTEQVDDIMVMGIKI